MSAPDLEKLVRVEPEDSIDLYVWVGERPVCGPFDRAKAERVAQYLSDEFDKVHRESYAAGQADERAGVVAVFSYLWLGELPTELEEAAAPEKGSADVSAQVREEWLEGVAGQIREVPK